MKESISSANQNNHHKNKKDLKKIWIFVLVVIFLFSAYIAFRALTYKEKIEESKIINTIEQKVNVEYSAIVRPSILYPQGGKINPDKAIFTQITQNLIIDMKMEMSYLKPVKIDAVSQVILRIIAEDTWQRDAVLIAQAPVDIDGSDPNIIDREIDISLDEILSFIDSVEKETLVRPASYQLQIIPRITGDILNEQGKKIASADNEVVIPFIMSSQYLKYAAEEDKKEFINKIDIEDKTVLSQNFEVFGIHMPIRLSQILFSALALISLFALAAIIKMRSSVSGKNEEQKLKVKYADQMAYISEDTQFGDKTRIILKDFKSLIKISEEKEEPILKQSDKSAVGDSYHVIGANHIYTYKSGI